MFPTTSAPTLETWQLQFAGLTIGPGTPYDLKSSDFAKMPDIRSGDSDRSREHGQLAGLDLYAGRDTTITGNVKTDGTSVMHAVRLLGAAFARGGVESPLWVNLPEFGTLATMCKVRKRNIPLDIDFYAAGIGRVSMFMHSTDPRLYGAPQTVTSTLTTAGMTIDNTGDVEMRPILKITGLCTNPTVFNSNGNFALTFTDPAQGAGKTVKNALDYLTIDLDRHTVTYFDHATGITSNVRNWVTPGCVWEQNLECLSVGNNGITFESTDVSDPGGVLSVLWAPSFII